MAAKDFVQFYTNYLPKHPDLKAKVESADSAKSFATAVLQEGKKAGFSFNEEDVDKVLIASLAKGAKSALSESQLEGVVGGAAGAIGTIQVSTVRSLTGLQVGEAASTVMCPGLFTARGQQVE